MKTTFQKRAPNNTCVETMRGKVDWRNAFLAEEVARRRQSDPASFGTLRLLPFHQASQRWGRLLHTRYSDCTHPTCYTPYFWVPLWNEALSAILNITGAGTPLHGAMTAKGR